MHDFPSSHSGADYSGEERRWLLRLAHASIRAAVLGESAPQTEGASEHLREKRGAFVTLHKGGKLRGCIGMLMAAKPLDETVRAMARAAALEDLRFAPVTAEELPQLQVEISVLSPMREIAPEDVVVGRDGLLITHGARRGLLLPQVPVEWKWNREQFLSQTCLKAGLPADQWQLGAKIEAFTAEVFGERWPGESLG